MSEQRRRRRDRQSMERRARRRRAAAGAGLSVGAALGLTASAQAADFTVTNLTDADPGSLRDAIDQANAVPSPDRILFQSGLSGTIGLTTGELYIDYPVEIVGPGAGALTVSGGDTQRIFSAAPLGPGNLNFSISGLTLSGGSAAGGRPSGLGGAIQAYDTNLSIVDSVITGNVADDGGGVGVEYGSLVVRGSTFSDNETPGAGGGVMAIQPNTVTIDRSTISGNTAYLFGGGMLVPYAGTVTVTDSTISGNHADFPGGGGGGLASLGAGTAVVKGSTISGNDTAGEGAGLYSLGEPMRIERSTVSGNTAAYAGGGIAAFFGAVQVVDSTIAANTVTDPAGYGGGMFLCNCASAALQNTIAADNSASQGADVYLSGGAPLDAAFSLIEAPVGAGTVNETVPGSNRPGVDPQLGVLAGNGGPTQTMALPAASPAVNQGSSPSGTDQRGLTRPVAYPAVPFSTAAGANGADMGAFELQAAESPSNKFDFGNLKRDVKTGTAYLILFVPGPGEIGLQGKGIAGVPLSKATSSREVGAGGVVKLKIRAGKGKAGRKIRRALAGKGTATFTVKVTFLPRGGTANMRTRKIKLVKHGR